ncbi:hypothetical protein ACIBG7_15245 [Nonomuraea sp. NPDC050328]|uniref:hypothetical protein n=1 Tax=Nonomuraea sp. NPDC050328 TaxID=3364361 RepID=UPI0037BC9FAB
MTHQQQPYGQPGPDGQQSPYGAPSPAYDQPAAPQKAAGSSNWIAHLTAILGVAGVLAIARESKDAAIAGAFMASLAVIIGLCGLVALKRGTATNRNQMIGSIAVAAIMLAYMIFALIVR